MDRLLSYSRASRRKSIFQWNRSTFVNGLLTLSVLFGLSTLWSRQVLDDQIKNATPRQLSTSYQVIGLNGVHQQQPKLLLVPVKFDKQGHPVLLFNYSHYSQSIDCTYIGPYAIGMHTAEGLRESSSVLHSHHNKKVNVQDTLTIACKEDTIVADKERQSEPCRLSSIPWHRLDTADLGRNATRGTPFLVGGSVLLVLGAAMLKRALVTAQRWDHQLQVDSLAYDLAYTDTRIYPWYGSVVSDASLDEFDRFDV